MDVLTPLDRRCPTPLSPLVAFAGCIPVFFHPYQNASFPWLWPPHWETRARVLIPRHAFINRAIDLRDLLSSVPPSLLGSMQEALAVLGRRFQISLNDDVGDQVDVLLRAARERALREDQPRQHRGQSLETL